MRNYNDNIVQKISDTVKHMIYYLSGSIVSVGTLIKDDKVIVSQPIIPKQVKTCICFKKTYQTVYMDTNTNHKIINISIILGDQQA